MRREKADAKAQSALVALRERSTDEAREELLKLMGVGRKVADCILLMSLDKVRSDVGSTDSQNAHVWYTTARGGAR